MKKLIFLLMALPVLAIAQPEPQKTDSEIKDVTVFFNQAEVTRTATASFSKGTSVLKFHGLSEYVKPASVQVSARGNFTILGVKHQVNYLDEQKPDEEIEKLRDRIEEINEDINDNNTTYSVYQKEEQLLDQNRQLGGSQTGVNVDEIKKAADFYRQRLTEIKNKQLELTRANQKLLEERQKLQNQINNLASKEVNPTSEVLVIVEADAAISNAKFELKYVVSNANWYPTYDIRGEELGDPLAITWKANVSQNTGVDWKDVNLTVSTGDPTLGAVKPELGTWYLDMRNGVPYGFKSGGLKKNITKVLGRVMDESGEGIPFANIVVTGTSVGTSSDYEGYYELTLPQDARWLTFSYLGNSEERIINSEIINVYLNTSQKLSAVEVPSKNRDEIQRMPKNNLTGIYGNTMATEDAEAAPPAASAPQVAQQTQTTTREFSIESKYDISSGGSPTTVQINRIDVPANYVYYTVPKEELDAFLVAELTEWDTLNLIGGEANLYFEGTYVGKTVIDPSNTEDTLSLSLGRDQSVIVSREKQKDFTKKQFLGGNKIQSIGWKITVRNKKSKSIKIVMQDQIPVSKTKEIEVELERKDGAELNKTTGHLEWVLDIPASSAKSVEFKYTVKYPKNGNIPLE